MGDAAGLFRPALEEHGQSCCGIDVGISGLVAELS